MMTQSSQCDREQLARLLDGQLDDAAQTLVAAHLETCDGCRELLQTFAADKQWWQETREALSEQDVLDEESAAAFRDQRDAVAPTAPHHPVGLNVGPMWAVLCRIRRVC